MGFKKYETEREGQIDFSISSPWKLLIFRLDEENDIRIRETSGSYEGGAF